MNLIDASFGNGFVLWTSVLPKLNCHPTLGWTQITTESALKDNSTIFHNHPVVELRFESSGIDTVKFTTYKKSGITFLLICVLVVSLV